MTTLDSTTFDVVRRRLQEQAAALGTGVAELDAERRRLFGASRTELSATYRVRTENASIPRDIIHLPGADGGRFLLGCEVVLGLRAAITPEDIFTELAEREGQLDPVAPAVVADAAFRRDVAEIFAYYKSARLLHLRRTETQVLVVFQTGQRLSDLKVLRFDIAGDGTLNYRDNRGDRDYVFPSSHDFSWTRTTRDQHVLGDHPHIAIADTIFVECVGGDLTLKIENNTTTGQGIYAEPVDNPTQGLDDAEIFFAVLESCILLKIRPYQERDWRFLAYNRLTREVQRIDELGLSCQQLPEGHGIVFPGGAYLADGRLKRFPVETAQMEFKRAVRAPNGEDVCYVFYRRDLGTYLLALYNLITRELAAPIACHSWCKLPDGRVFVLRAETEATRVHTLQVWNTPFCSDEHHAAMLPAEDSYLVRVGNRELVRAVSDLLQLQRLVAVPTPTRNGYEALLKHLARCRDAFPWLVQVGDLSARMREVQSTAEQVVDEFEKVSELTAAAARRLSQQASAVEALLLAAQRGARGTLDDHVQPLARMRAERGVLASLREVRFIDLAAITGLEQRISKAAGVLGAETADFLLSESALAAVTGEIAALEASGAAAATVSEAGPLIERLAGLASGLDGLVELVGTLDLSDQTRRTAILERIASVYAAVGRAKAIAANRRTELGQVEGRSAFAVQVQLLGQAVSNSLSLATDPGRCDELSAKLLIQLEELEGRFGDFPEFVAELGVKRAEIAEAFAGARQRLLDARARQADGVNQALDRMLATVARRCASAANRDELNAYLAADPLVQKTHALIGQLRALGGEVAASDADGRLAAARDAGLRRLRDQAELFEGDAVKLGRHRFAINRTPLELTLLPRRDAEGRPGLVFHLTGTEYERRVSDPDLAGTEHLWEQTTEAETEDVARAEHLAWSLLERLPAAADEATMTAAIAADMVAHPELGYERGIHDHDALLLLRAYRHLREAGGLLRFSPSERAAAQCAWATAPDPALAVRCRSLAALSDRVGPMQAQRDLATAHGAYLVAELARCSPPVFVRSLEAVQLAERFSHWCRDQLLSPPTTDSALLTTWVAEVAARIAPELQAAVPEVVAGLLFPQLAREQVSAHTTHVVEGLLASHPRIRDGRLSIRLDETASRLGSHLSQRVPAYRAFQLLRRSLVERERERLRLDEFRPQVLASFVRNRLVDEVLLPLIGDNLAKQIGALGPQRRTDLQGLLLLISPPGYGKTTLMEYLAAVLGLVFVKVNGPALGHKVTSLDPAEAPNAAARQEVERINLGLAMGSNVLLYLDDIQHTDPELLQKFISLCDGQRRIEGVWEGRSKTFDLRGKRFVVCMAGNPYTESGARFRIPDMLANRADTCNLGDIVGGAHEAFALSYLENCLVANPVLKPLASRTPADLTRLLAISAGDDGPRSELEHPYTATEIAEISAVLQHLQRIQRALLTVNQAYIASAAQSDADRVEPPFKLQGSYRNMGKLAAKVAAAMTPDEIERLLSEHYRQEAQTLTQGAESNLLKLKQLLGWLTDAGDQQRWADLCRGFSRRTELAGTEDPVSQAVLQLAKLVEGVAALRQVAERPQPAPTLEVINTLPAYYAKLYEQHLQVLQTSLIPILQQLTAFTGNQAQTRAELDAIGDELRGVLAKQRKAGRIELDERLPPG